ILFSFSFCAYLALPALPSVPTRRSSDLNAKRTLEQNVVLRDDLPVQAAWLLEDPEFITAEGLTFQRVDELEGDDPSLSWPERADLVAALDVGTYYVSGQDLYIKVGMDTELATTEDLKDQITPVD